MLNYIKKLIPRRLFRALQPVYHFVLSWLAVLVYRFPSRNLIVIGVTGTAGKTSTSYLIMKMLSEAGYKTGLTSTAIFSDGNQEWLNDKKMTMPGRFFIARLLRQMVRNGCVYAVVETTSEGIKQFRHLSINYDILVFTGLYPEHIESHGSFEKYKAAKGSLFKHLRYCRTKYVDGQRQVCQPRSGLKKLDLTRVAKTIIVNGDDAQADYFLNFWSEAKIVYTLQPGLSAEHWRQGLSTEAAAKDFSVILASDIEAGASGTSFRADGEQINLRLLGEFNALNGLAAYAVGLNQRLEKTLIKKGLEAVSGLAGKLENIIEGQNFTVIVDYSFEPKALEKLYQTIDIIPHQRLIHILGSTGGGRDKARRSIMGKLAGENADLVIVTNEDPYDEDIATIINQVAIGAEEAGKEVGQNLLKILDRREAMRTAFSVAEEGDLVLITGKGAEQWICLAGGKKEAWDDRQVAREELAKIRLAK